MSKPRAAAQVRIRLHPETRAAIEAWRRDVERDEDTRMSLAMMAQRAIDEWAAHKAAAR